MRAAGTGAERGGGNPGGGALEAFSSQVEYKSQRGPLRPEPVGWWTQVRGGFAVLEGACPNPTVLESRSGRRSQGGWSRVDLEGRAAGGWGPWRRISSCILGWGRRPGSKALPPKAGPAPQVWEQISRHWAESPGVGSVSQVGWEGVLGGRIEDRDSEELVLHQAIPQRLLSFAGLSGLSFQRVVFPQVLQFTHLAS